MILLLTVGPLPKTLHMLSHLKLLNLSGNRLTGEVPSDLKDITGLTTLDLTFNQVSGAGVVYCYDFH